MYKNLFSYTSLGRPKNRC